MERKHFENIYIDIVGFCNAGCPYCTTGAKNSPRGGLMTRENLAKIINILIEQKAAGKDSVIHLYNWGEPFLHPGLFDLVETINSYGLKYALSTNASKLPSRLDRDFARNLKLIIYSMSGFSQSSYDKIHGLKFERVIRNISSLTNCVRYHNKSSEFLISYHVYRFNVKEMKACERFADGLGIEFSPRHALLADWWQMESYLSDSKNKEKIEDEIFISGIREVMSKTPRDYVCPQYNGLSLDEAGNILTCCVLPRNHPDYSSGNIFSDDLQRALTARKTRDVCKHCIGTGLAGYYNALICPPMYKKSIEQIFLPLKYNNYKKIFMNVMPASLVRFLKRIRNFKG